MVLAVPFLTTFSKTFFNFLIVSGLAIDNDGDIWVASVRGLFTYNPQIGIARRFVQNEVNNISYRCFYVTKANEIVIGTNRGLRIYNKKLKTCPPLCHASARKSIDFLYICLIIRRLQIADDNRTAKVILFPFISKISTFNLPWERYMEMSVWKTRC